MIILGVEKDRAFTFPLTNSFMINVIAFRKHVAKRVAQGNPSNFEDLPLLTSQVSDPSGCLK